jgi:hypothetical protein
MPAKLFNDSQAVAYMAFGRIDSELLPINSKIDAQAFELVYFSVVCK